MKTKLDIQKILKNGKNAQKGIGSFDKALYNLGVKFPKSSETGSK